MEANKILNNRYQIIKQIGSGGMAKVYEANDPYLQRKVAVKVINLVSNIDDLTKQRFLQEIKAVTRVRHANVISVYDIFIENDDWCLVLELVKGKTLKDYLKNTGVLSIKETLSIFEKVLLGVAACHKVGVIHRDLKPDNILMANNGAIKVLDFGIAMIDGYEVKKHEHQVVGTMKYIAPEVVKFEKPTTQSDIYSLGIILFELLTGKPPFFHKNPQLLANKHLKDTMPLVNEFNPLIPQSVANIIIKATSKNPNHRYLTIDDMKQDLITCLDENRQNEKIIKEKDKPIIPKKIIRTEQPFFLKKWFFFVIALLILSFAAVITLLIIFL